MDSMSANDLPETLKPHWQAIQQHFSGLLYIPVALPNAEKMVIRNGQIFAEKLQGGRAEDIAKRYGLSRNRVHKICAAWGAKVRGL